MKKDELLSVLHKLERFEVNIRVLDFMSKTTVKLNHVLALVEQLDEPEKLIIPQFVADWWEREGDSVKLYGGMRVDKKCKLYIISNFHDKGLGDYLSKVEDWIYKNNSTFLDLVNGKPYEVEKEPLYYVELPGIVWSNEASELEDRNFYLKLNLSSGEIIITPTNTKIGDWCSALTEKEIKDYDPRYWPFATEVKS